MGRQQREAYMGKKFLTTLVILYLILGISSFVSAEQIAVDYYFEKPEIINVDIGGEQFQRIIMKDAPNSGDIGNPALPARGARILIPYGADVTGIEIIAEDMDFLGSDFYIEPIGRPVKLSSNPGPLMPPEPNKAVYESDQVFPSEDYKEIGVFEFRGYQILNLRLQPFEYTGATGELGYYRHLTVIVNTSESRKEAELFRGFAQDELEVSGRVDNPDDLGSYMAASKRDAKNFDLLIITTTSLAGSFQPLKDYHDTTGFITEIHTTTDIGSTDPDDVRDYIRDRYLNDGIDYVLIGADDDLIPAKDLYVESWEGYGAEIEYSMPGDVYFGCLDGTYNYDGDSYWGEPNDGAGGGDVDLIAEVYVGRACVGSTTEADRFVNKTIQYLTSTSGYLQNVLMCGEYLGFGGVSDYAGTMMDQMVDGSSADGYTTVGIPSDLYSVDRLYDRDWPGNDWPSSELTSRINGGLHVINHLGHGSETSALKLSTSSIMSSLNNADHLFLYSQACLSGHFDGLDCYAEYMNIKSDYAAFAVVMNARYGWGTNSSTDGPSQRFDREFWDAVFSTSENKPELGRANQDSKEDNLYRIDESCMRWCYYEANLFGDPTVAIRVRHSLQFDYPDGIPSVTTPNQEKSFEVVINGAYGGAMLAGSGMLHYAVNGGVYDSIPLQAMSAIRHKATLPGLNCGDEIEFYFSAEEETSGRIYDPDPQSPHQAICAAAVVTVFEDDFQTDKGWTVTGDALDGQWNRGVPAGLGERGDPAADYDGSGSCYLTDNEYGNSDVDDGTTILTSPIFDLTAGNASIHYARWYSNNYGNAPYADTMKVFLTNNGGSSWTLVEKVGPVDEAAGGWVERTIWVSEYITQTDQMRIRFEASDLSDGSVVEAAIDDFVVTCYSCGQSAPQITTESLPAWTVGNAYSELIQALGGTGAFTWSDKNSDLIGTGLSLATDGTVSGTPLSSGVISFVAMVTDEESATDEKQFNITINSHVDIADDTPPDWTVGQAYADTMHSTGGTGAIVWTDKNSDLSGTGLIFSSGGLIIGTPSSAGPVTFIARAVDDCGDFDEKTLNITINPAVAITTETLPEGTETVEYSSQLEMSGGTGQIAWTDKNNDLDGSGLTLSPTGLLSGTPALVGTVEFTAMAEDNTGSSDEQILTVEIGPAWVCGDVDGDGTVNLLDVTFLLSYIYKSGDAPPVLEAADVNNTGELNILDITYLINYLYKDGPDPDCG